jgi:DNA-binding protein YbaB
MLLLEWQKVQQSLSTLQAHQSSQQIIIIVLVGEHDIQAVEQDQQLSTSRSQ